jgi:GNAT superfamily N-acetyltransferase
MKKFNSIFMHQKDRISRLNHLIQKKEFSAFLKKIVAFLIELIYLRNDGYLLEIEDPKVVFEPPNKISYKINELQKAIDLSGFFVDLNRKNVAYRMNNGEHGFIVKHKNHVIGTIWLTNQLTYFPGFEFRIVSKSKWLNKNPKEGFLYRGAVDPAFRGNKILVAMYNTIFIKAKELGIRRLITSMGVHNIAARKQAQRSGWKVIYRVNCFRLFGFCFRQLTVDNNCG